MKKKLKVVFEYDDEIVYSIPKQTLDPARLAVNTNFFGNVKVNIPDNVNGYMKSNPKLDDHPNRQACRDAHWSLNAGQVISVHVKVYSNGTTEIKPFKRKSK